MTGQKPGLFYFNVRRSDHLAPSLGLLDDELIEFGRRAHKYRSAQVSDPRDDLGIGEPRVDLLVELVDDRDGRVPWSSDRYPRAGIETLLKVAKRWNVW
jgi:hypothetical protein